MTRFLFIQDLTFEYFGPMYLSSMLKKAGHDADIFVTYGRYDIHKEIEKSRPDVIAFSILSTGQNWAFDIAREIKKKHDILILFGGPHPTFFPEMIKEPSVDMISIGEGEETIVDLADNIRDGRPIENIQNLWVKREDKTFKNPVRSLIKDLDSIPFPDRELYYRRYPFLKSLPTKRFLASRGCPYNCTYCFNHKLKEIYQGKGRYVRWRSPVNIIEEIEDVRKNYPLKTVRFVDDTFTMNKRWLYLLLDLYRDRIGLPFTCLARANEVDEKTAKSLKDAGCIMVTFGIESGSERIRNKVICKSLKNSDIIRAARLFKKHRLRFGTYNMIALPGERIEDAYKTLELNAKIGTDNPMCSIFQPFPKTQLTSYAIQNGYLKKDFDFQDIGNFFDTTPLNIKNKEEFVNLHKFFLLGVWFPRLIPLIKRLSKLPPNPFYNLIYKITYGIKAIRSFNANIFTSLRLGYLLRDRFKDPSKK